MALLLAAATASAQTDTALYLRFPQVPPFTLYKAPDSTKFTKDDLAGKKKTLLIIFSPDCDHCQHETKALTDTIKAFKKIQIVMATYLPYAEMMKFYTDYNIAAYPNITMGWDKSFFLPPFFKLNSLPFMALYDKKGKLITTFEGTVAMKKILTAFEQPLPDR